MKYYVLAGLMLLAGAVNAGETNSSDWKLSLGVTHRSFGDIDFKHFSLGKSANAGFVDPYDISQNPQTGTLIVKNPILNPDGSLTLHSGASAGHLGSKQLDDSTGLILGASKDFACSGGFMLSLDLSLSYVKTDISPSVGGPLSASKYSTQALPSFGGIYFFKPDSTSTTSSMVGRINYDLDLRLYTMGLGLGGRMPLGPVDLKVSAGPSLTVADYSASMDASVTPTGGGAVSSSHVSEKDVDFLLGLYAAIELQYQFDEQLAVSLGYRYDLMQEVDTMIGDIDPSGGSAELKVIYSF